MIIGKCIGSIIEPIEGIWPVKNGRTNARARKIPDVQILKIVFFSDFILPPPI